MHLYCLATEKEDRSEDPRVSLPDGSNSSSKSGANSAYYVLGYFVLPPLTSGLTLLMGEKKKGGEDS